MLSTAPGSVSIIQSWSTCDVMWLVHRLPCKWTVTFYYFYKVNMVYRYFNHVTFPRLLCPLLFSYRCGIAQIFNKIQLSCLIIIRKESNSGLTLYVKYYNESYLLQISIYVLSITDFSSCAILFLLRLNWGIKSWKHDIFNLQVVNDHRQMYRR